MRGPVLAQEGRGAGPVWRPGRRLLGRGPRRARIAQIWAERSFGPRAQSRLRYEFHLYSEALSYYFVNSFDLYSNLNQRDNLFREK